MLSAVRSRVARSAAVRATTASRDAVRCFASDGFMFDKIMIANRGEIACRVMESARKMGVKTVALYSDADAASKHVAMADEAFRLGPAPASESYLLGDKILNIAKDCGAQAVHPGYGFLSENEHFAKACAANDVTFIGPPASAIHDMGSKSASKDIMIAAGVPVTPGYHGDDQSMETLQREADNMGYPVMIKAVLGGGGKGMRIVRSSDGLRDGVDACKREAIASFGDDRVLIERYLEEPRHIELQVFADTHGNAVHLFERDCSVQRRHQKVLEEAPAPHMDPEIRARMGQSAVDAAKAVGYCGAGTVEFMLDHDGSYYFMEMNTRLQVEHPVTELITGQDLVQWQLLVAAGHPLPLTQEELSINGHALEARVYAENPNKDFLPQTGTLHHLSPPAASRNVRVDTGVRQGDSVSIYYDPMISKLITWGKDRPEALRHMQRALEEYEVVGLSTNLNFLKSAVRHPAFDKGGVDTSFLEVHLDEVLPPVAVPPPPARALGAIAHALSQQDRERTTASSSNDATSPWGAGNASRPNGVLNKNIAYESHGEDCSVTLSRSGDNGFTVTAGDETFEGTATFDAASNKIVALLNGVKYTANVVIRKDDITVFPRGTIGDAVSYQLDIVAPDFGQGAAGGAASVVTPMPGKVIKVAVKAGDEVKEGDELLILEAMKMEHVIRAPMDGVIASLNFEDGGNVEDGTVLVTFEDTE